MPAAESLDEDARVLAQTLAVDHARLASAQALAWVWRDRPEATDQELASLGATEVASTEALAIALRAGPSVEVLRAAAELELDRVEQLLKQPFDEAGLARALADVTRAAPRLADLRVELVGALPRRGRAFGDVVFVGMPGIAGAEAWHVAWQAAHEATTLEAHAHGARTHEQVERFALRTLASRARAEGLADGHARWLATLDLSELGPIADEDDGTG